MPLDADRQRAAAVPAAAAVERAGRAAPRARRRPLDGGAGAGAARRAWPRRRGTSTSPTCTQRLPVRGAARRARRSRARLQRHARHGSSSAVGEMRQFSAAHRARAAHAAGGAARRDRAGADAGRARSRTTAGRSTEPARRARQAGPSRSASCSRSRAPRRARSRWPRAPVDLAALAASLVEQLEPVAQARGDMR